MGRLGPAGAADGLAFGLGAARAAVAANVAAIDRVAAQRSVRGGEDRFIVGLLRGSGFEIGRPSGR
jgi:hypothetical protein